MADVVKNNRTLNMTLSFEDGDTRAISVDNPDTTLNLGTHVDSLGAFCREKNIFLGDKGGADCTGIREAYIKNDKVTYLDLT